MNTNWPFDEPPDSASLTTAFVLDGSPILRVYHDYDGGWQFHGAPDDPVDESVARVVSLESMVSRDASLMELHDLPYGWAAHRVSSNDIWIRSKNHPFPTYEENGFYLEDVAWLAQFRDDVNPPPVEICENLSTGTYVKLIFRFAAEDAERVDYESERMWVQVIEVDDEGNYVGRLDNDPHHSDTLAADDLLHFHSLHVLEVLDE